MIVYLYQFIQHSFNNSRGHCGRDRMIVGFTTTYAVSDYHHWCCGFDSHSRRGVQHYMIKFVSDLRQVMVFSSTNKTDHHDIAEILFKVALNTIKQTKYNNFYMNSEKRKEENHNRMRTSWSWLEIFGSVKTVNRMQFSSLYKQTSI